MSIAQIRVIIHKETYKMTYSGGVAHQQSGSSVQSKAWFRRRTFHVPNLTEQVRLWSDTGATSDSDGVPCVEPKLRSTKIRQSLSNLTLLPHQTKTAVPN